MSDTTKAPANRKDKWQQHLEDGERLVRVFVAGVER